MTEIEINIAIAKACGWKIKGNCINCGKPQPTGYDPIDSVQRFVPDYCHDLNAMHEVESALDVLGQQEYVHKLWKTNPKAKMPEYIWNQESLSQEIWWTLTHATTRQRVEAFLRVKGLWK